VAPAAPPWQLPPKTPGDFERTLRTVRSDVEQLGAFFRLIPAQTFPRLFATLLDGDLLSDVLRGIAAAHSPGDMRALFEALSSLVSVSRFDVVCLFMGPSDKQMVSTMAQAMLRAPDRVGQSVDDIRKLVVQFGVLV